MTSKVKYKTWLFHTLCVSIIAALMFFITQGNSMFVTDLFADKVAELVDCETPVPAEERSDSETKNNNVSEEELHFRTNLFEFVSDSFAKINLQFENCSLHSVLKQRVLTPPPEFS